MYSSYFEIIVNVLNSGQNGNYRQKNFQQYFYYPNEIMSGLNFGNIN